MAAILLARLLTRPDTTQQLEQFLEWTATAPHADTAQSVFLIPGVPLAGLRALDSDNFIATLTNVCPTAVIHTLATIFKLGTRAALLSLAPKVSKTPKT
eukprot:scaffold103142_cov33-Prasinocladus_malaysianus.AAC.1